MRDRPVGEATTQSDKGQVGMSTNPNEGKGGKAIGMSLTRRSPEGRPHLNKCVDQILAIPAKGAAVQLRLDGSRL